MKQQTVFPKNFYFGAATASYQVEGWNENTDWAYAARDRKVPLAGRLADHYNRYEEDFDVAVKLGHTAHRFSIEWARIEPREGQWDEEEIKHYRDVLLALKKRKLEPFITLWHFTLPQWFASSGGFERRDAPEIFARYCAKVVAELGDLCTHVTTMNEPNVYATHGYLYGAWPPFKRVGCLGYRLGKEDGTSERTRASVRCRHLFTYTKVVRQLARAHRAAYDAIKAERNQVLVGVVKHVHFFDADAHLINRLKARIAIYFQTHQFLKRVEQHLDEIGVNYYRHTKFGDNKDYLRSDMDWKIYPSGIFGALKEVARYGVPLYVAEAGIADRDDDIRGDYIAVQLEAVSRALAAGIDVRGHMYWSLLDNYEWALGVEKRFGLVAIDYATLARTIRPSALLYRDLIRQYQGVDTARKKRPE